MISKFVPEENPAESLFYYPPSASFFPSRSPESRLIHGTQGGSYHKLFSLDLLKI